jgi:hypothetical protein
LGLEEDELPGIVFSLNFSEQYYSPLGEEEVEIIVALPMMIDRNQRRRKDEQLRFDFRSTGLGRDPGF